MTKYLVAVSGGVDSVALLHMLSQAGHDLVVAHVDHGIREDSAADERFVAELARRYGLPYVSTRYELGEQASEEDARTRRYEFLVDQAAQHDALLVTAHHRGDAVESVAINLARGTGWRGLAVLGRDGLVRPLVTIDKDELYDYALTHRLEWVEDSTNATDRYQRNRLRRRINRHVDMATKQKVMNLREQQIALRRQITQELKRLARMHMGSRYFLTHVDEHIGIELLGQMIVIAGGVRPTRPQLLRALLSVKTARPRTKCQVGEHIELHFSSRKFEVKVV